MPLSDEAEFRLAIFLRDYVLKVEFDAEVKEMHKDLQEVKDAIIEKQQQSYKRIITMQGAMLLPVVIAVIVYIIQRLL